MVTFDIPAARTVPASTSSRRLLCSLALHSPATAYARALNQAVWQERDEGSLAERLEPFKAVFLAGARRSLT
ncbi:hypothetical protein ACPCKL_17830 [Streptomyces cellulosae]